MNKIKAILKSEKGQGVWEYMVILVGIGAVAFLVTQALKSGLVGGEGITEETTTDKVVNNINDLIDDSVDPNNTGGTGETGGTDG